MGLPSEGQGLRGKGLLEAVIQTIAVTGIHRVDPQHMW
jgi:hypothetical protein